jgi:hypothetical protein
LTYRRGSLYLGGKRNNLRKYRYIALVEGDTYTVLYDGPRLYGSSLAGFRLVSMKRLTMLDDISLDRSLKVSTMN